MKVPCNTCFTGEAEVSRMDVFFDRFRFRFHQCDTCMAAEEKLERERLEIITRQWVKDFLSAEVQKNPQPKPGVSL